MAWRRAILIGLPSMLTAYLRLLGRPSGGRFGGGLAFQLADPFFHLLARLERYDELLGNVHLLARPRVARLAGSPLLDLKDPEVPQLDAAVLYERLNDGVERLLDDLLRLELRQTDLLGDRFDDLFLGHQTPPREKGIA